MLFERGDRVISIRVPSTYQGILWEGQQGTVTHLPGDKGFDSTPNFVWVQWDNPVLEEGWREVDKLRKM